MSETRGQREGGARRRSHRRRSASSRTSPKSPRARRPRSFPSAQRHSSEWRARGSVSGAECAARWGNELDEERRFETDDAARCSGRREVVRAPWSRRCPLCAARRPQQQAATFAALTVYVSRPISASPQTYSSASMVVRPALARPFLGSTHRPLLHRGNESTHTDTDTPISRCNSCAWNLPAPPVGAPTPSPCLRHT